MFAICESLHFISRSNSKKRVENKKHSGALLRNFEVFDIVMKYCVFIFLQRFPWNFCGIPITSKKNKKNPCSGAKIIFGFEWYTSCDKVLDHANWFSLNNLYDVKLLSLPHRSFYQTTSQLSRKVLKSTTAVIIYEQSLRLRYLFPRQVLRKSSCYKALTLWNCLESHRREISKGHWKVGFLRKYF